ncbi:unnamed protein product, partial [Arabidopsis halleri]
MSRRYSRSEKEKWPVCPSKPRRSPVRIPESDNSALISEGRLSLIGRVTNPSIQRPRAIVDFMPQYWNLTDRVRGRELGPDLFQFFFESETDLLSVLNKSPYHFKKWMLILQRWEPVVSDDFPSQISFWIKIVGIPTHFRTEQTISTIGKELGSFLTCDVSQARVRVEINGLLPLETTMEVQLPGGQLKTVEFESDALSSLPHSRQNASRLSGPVLRYSPPRRSSRDNAPTRRISPSASRLEFSIHCSAKDRLRPSAHDRLLPSSSRDRHSLRGSRQALSSIHRITHPREDLLSSDFRPKETSKPFLRDKNSRSLNPIQSEPSHCSHTPPARPEREAIVQQSDHRPEGPSMDRNRRPALERLSPSTVSALERLSLAPALPPFAPASSNRSLGSSRLQDVEIQYFEPPQQGLTINVTQEVDASSPPGFPPRIPASLRIGSSAAPKKKASKKPPVTKGASSSTKAAGTRKVPRSSAAPRLVKSPLKGASLRKRIASTPSAPASRRKNPHRRALLPSGIPENVALTILSSSANFIDSTLFFQGKCSFLTFIYGEPNQELHKDFWDSMIELGSGRDQSWLLTGDFNDILDNAEKRGGPLRCEGSFIPFRNFVSLNGLMDLQHSGNSLSRRDVSTSAMRAQTIARWSLILTIPKERKRSFRFDRRLIDDVDARKVIEDAWSAAPSDSFLAKLNRVRRDLIAWSKANHVNNGKIIKDFQKNLEESLSSDIPNQPLIDSFKAELEKLYKQEELFLRQRSRVQWLHSGDKNSNFFHSVTRGRRALNKLSVIESTSGESFYEEEHISKAFSDYYQEIFSTNSSADFQVVSEALQPLITQEMNSNLISIPEKAEIRAAVFDIHSDKAPGPDGFSAGFYQAYWDVIGILAGREILRRGLGWSIGSGSSINVWSEPWLSSISPSTPIGPPSSSNSTLVVKDLISPVPVQAHALRALALGRPCISPSTKDWDLNAIRLHLPHYEAPIRNLILSSHNQEDSLVWLPAKSGLYTTKSGYALAKLNNQNLSPCDFNWQGIIWNTKTTPKIKMFLWKLLIKALPPGSTLAARGLISSVTCKRCGGQEDAIHLLLTCPFAARVWELALVLFKPCPSSVQDPFSLLKAAKKMITLPPVGLSLSPLFPWIWWHLWKARNYLLYEDKVWSDSEVLDKAISDARSWQMAQVLPPKQRTPPASRVILPPLRKDFVCFVDAAWIATSGNSGMGWVFHDYLGSSIHHGSSSRPFVPSALAAEALAVKQALLSALDHELFHLQVFSDSQTLVRLLNAKESTVELRGILFDISFLRLRFISLSFN